jgi:hypothetical protein
MPMRRSSGASVLPARLTTSPPRRISPALTGSSPATARSRVVLPQPDGPISTPISPARKPNDAPRTAACARPG